MKILVLNNDEMERSVIRQVLQHNGHEVIAAGTSEDAMQVLREGEVRFVIVDRDTSDAEERQFIRHLRDARPPYYIYILLLASRIQDVDVLAPQRGADDYLHKPVTPLELKSRVHVGQRILDLEDNFVSQRGMVESAALFDPLTNTLNETAFLRISRGEFERARRTQAPLSLVAIEVENTREIAEKHGEAVADEVLVLVSQAIREKSRPYDGVGRHQMNIFLLPLPGVIGQDAEKVAIRIVKGILGADISLQDGTAVQVRVDAGVASALRVTAATGIEILIAKACEAVARSRQAADGQVHTIFL